MRFEFATAGRIVFGPGCLREAGTIAREFGHRALLLTGADRRRAESLEAILSEAKIAVTPFSVAGEPTVGVICEGVEIARRNRCDLVIGMGGGSALDAAKAIAGLMTNEGQLIDYLEVIGQGKNLTKPSAPCIAIPTTAGTGAEVTRNSVLSSPEHQVKVSLRSPFLLPRVALIDPELTVSLPPEITASTGLDALTQLIEPYVSSRANPLTDALCREGMERVARSLRRAFTEGTSIAAREDMSIASLFGGLALANAGLGAVHGFAAPLGGMFDAPHGSVCAALLPEVMEANVRSLRRSGPQAARRYDEVARLLTGKADATAEEGIQWVRALVTDLKIRPLGVFGVKPEHVPALAAKALKASSMKANPVQLSEAELSGILLRAL